jgi:hypothetical protein
LEEKNEHRDLVDCVLSRRHAVVISAGAWVDVRTLWCREPVIETLYYLPRVDVESLSYPQKSPQIDGVTGLNFLPMPKSEPKRNHIFLRITIFLSELFDAQAEVAIEALIVGRMAAFHGSHSTV